jgi:hypothetical protein
MSEKRNPETRRRWRPRRESRRAVARAARPASSQTARPEPCRLERRDASGPSLRSDCRGAILVPAVVMGSLLVGALFYVAAAGDAIVFRTQLQDSADTTAFTAAIWHAKGMNMIALLNVFMSLLLFVIVVFHFIELLCFVVGFVPGVGAIATTVGNAVMRFEQASSNFIASGLKLFEVTEEIVSVAAPIVAVQQAMTQKTRASSVLVGSLSLLPVAVDKRIINKTLNLEETRMPSVDVAPALPIQPDSFGGLCVQSASYLPELIVLAINSLVDAVPLGPLGFLGGAVKSGVNSAWETVRPTFEGLAAAGDGILCKPINEMLASLGNLAADAVEKTCDNIGADEQLAADHNNEAAGLETTAPTAQQKKDRQAASDKCAADIKDNASKQARFDAKPAMIWAPAGNGHAFTHIWSRASGTPQWLGRDADGMSFAGRGAFPKVAPSGVAFAEAEFYFDCAAKWSECMGDATWSPNWTARMRRFRPPQDELILVLKGPALDPATVLKESALNIGQALVPRLAKGNSRGEFAADAIFGALVNNIDKVPGLNTFMEKVNSLAAEGIDKLGISELLDPGANEDKAAMRRIH